MMKLIEFEKLCNQEINAKRKLELQIVLIMQNNIN